MPCRTPGAAWRPYAPIRAREQATTASTGFAATWQQWEYEVTSGGRIRYVIDDQHRTVWLIYASPRHPKDTDR
jgi:hypothetical protein